MKRLAGFTLIEMTLVIILLAIISATIGPMMMQGFKTVFVSRDLNHVHAQGQMILTRMASDFAQINPNVSTAVTAAAPSDATMTFNTNDGSDIAYVISGSDLMRKSPSSGAGHALATNVENLAFTFYDAEGALSSEITNAHYVKVSFDCVQGRQSADFERVYYLGGLG